jgi:hypothetical protein
LEVGELVLPPGDPAPDDPVPDGRVVGVVVLMAGGRVVTARRVVAVVLNSELSELDRQPGSLRSILPSRSLSRPSEHCGRGAAARGVVTVVVDSIGSVELVVVDSVPKGNANGVSGEPVGIGSNAGSSTGTGSSARSKA